MCGAPPMGEVEKQIMLPLLTVLRLCKSVLLLLTKNIKKKLL